MRRFDGDQRNQRRREVVNGNNSVEPAEGRRFTAARWRIVLLGSDPRTHFRKGTARETEDLFSSTGPLACKEVSWRSPKPREATRKS